MAGKKADPVAGMVEIVRQVLRCPEFDLSQSFASLGGTSLAAVHIVSLIEAEYQVSVLLEDFFDAPDMASVADLVRRAQPAPKEG